MKILVIEKSEVCRFMLDQCLTSLGHVFHHSNAPEELLQSVQAHNIDFVFIDFDFVRERAADAIKALRTEQQNDWFPVVAMSAESDDEVYANAILAGADAMLIKPLSRQRILMQVIALERIYIARQSLSFKKDLITANLALLKLSMFDELTGLANRRYFDETLNKEIKSSKRERRRLSLLIGEIVNADHAQDGKDSEFKNRCLIAIAAAVQCVPSRPTDFVSRYSANRFGVILPHTDEDGALHIAEKIQASVETVLAQITGDTQTTPPAFRIGMATHDGQFQSVDEFVDAASADMAAVQLKTT